MHPLDCQCDHCREERQEAVRSWELFGELLWEELNRARPADDSSAVTPE